MSGGIIFDRDAPAEVVTKKPIDEDLTERKYLAWVTTDVEPPPKGGIPPLPPPPPPPPPPPLEEDGYPWWLWILLAGAAYKIIRSD